MCGCVDGELLEEVGDDKEGNNLDDLVAHARTPPGAERLEVLRLLELKGEKNR